MKNLDKIQALNAIQTLRNSKANEEQKAAAKRLLQAPKESFKDALEKTDADLSTKDAYIKELETMYNSWFSDLEVVKRSAMEDFKLLNTIYTECSAKLSSLPQKKPEVSSASSAVSTSQDISTSSSAFSVPVEPFNMFENQTDEDFLSAYKIAKMARSSKEVHPEAQKGFYIAINRIKEELDARVGSIVHTDSRRHISIALEENWQNLMNDLTQQFKARKGVRIGELSYIEELVLGLRRDFEKEYGIDKILNMQKTLQKHNTEGL